MCKYGIHSVNYHLKKQNKKKNAKNYIMFKKSSDIYFSKDEYTLIQYIISCNILHREIQFLRYKIVQYRMNNEQKIITESRRKYN